jgi:YVTN family beta-propeller protein
MKMARAIPLVLMSLLILLAAIISGINIAKADSVVANIPVGQGPRIPAFHPVHNWLYVPNTGDNTVTVLKGTTLVATISDPSFNVPFGAAFDPANDYIYVTNQGNYPKCGNTVSVIQDLTVIATIKVGNCPLGVAFNEVNNNMYVVNFASASVSVIDSSTNTVTDNVLLGGIHK